MAVMAHAPVTVSDPDDWRFEALGDVAGYSRTDALGRMVRLWSYCTQEQLYIVTETAVKAHLGARGVEAIVAADLGEVVEGGVRVKGTAGVIEWFAPVKDKREKRRAGKVRAATATRDPKTGRLMATSPSCLPAPPAEHQHEDQQTTSRPPAEPTLLDQHDQHESSKAQPSESESESESEISETHTTRAIDIGTAHDQRKVTKRAAWEALLKAWRVCAKQVPHPGMRPPIDPTGPIASDMNTRLDELLQGGESYPQAGSFLVHAVECAAAKVRRDLNMKHLARCWSSEDWKNAMGATPEQLEAEIPSVMAIGPAMERRSAVLAASRESRKAPPRSDEPFRPELKQWGEK